MFRFFGREDKDNLDKALSKTRLSVLGQIGNLFSSSGIDEEGLQIGDGDIDWPALIEDLDRLAPNVPFIPEIWQGHNNQGEGFWLAMERLETYMADRKQQTDL